MSSANRAVIVVRRPPRVVALVKAGEIVGGGKARLGVDKRGRKHWRTDAAAEPRRVRSIDPGMKGLIERKEQDLRSGKTLTDEGIPRMWMVGAVQRLQREGMGPTEAHVAAIRHWHEQERLEEQHRRENAAESKQPKATYGRYTPGGGITGIGRNAPPLFHPSADVPMTAGGRIDFDRLGDESRHWHTDEHRKVGDAHNRHADRVTSGDSERVHHRFLAAFHHSEADRKTKAPTQDRYGRPLDPKESMTDRMKRESTGDSPEDRERRSKLKPASPPKDAPSRLSYQDLGLAPGLSRTYGVLRPGGEAAGSTDSIAAAHKAAAKIGGEVMIARGPDAGRKVRHDEGRSLGVKTRKDFPSGGDAKGGRR